MMNKINIDKVMALQMSGMPTSEIIKTDFAAFDKLYEANPQLEKNIDKANAFRPQIPQTKFRRHLSPSHRRQRRKLSSYRPKLSNENMTDMDLPMMMYLHGFMSGANGAKQRQLQKQYKGRYRVIAPELDADPEHSLEIINSTISTEKPEIIIGTSLGGWMALACENSDAVVVVVNPVTDPQTQLARWLNQPQTYFCKRLDGIQTYTLTSETLAKYGKYDIMRDIAASSTCGSLCSA